MEMNPQRVRTAEFKTVKRGLDPDEVQTFLDAVADELERAQNQSTAMEARARAAVARLQELSEGAASQSEAAGRVAAPAAEAPEVVEVSVDQAETISRTLLLAQRTADTTIASAQAEADELRSHADAESARTLDSTREMAANLLDEAREEARAVGAAERQSLEGEVSSLLARRDFLESDVDHMEQFVVAQRSRLRDAANELIELTERVPSGLGDVRRPLMSASNTSDNQSSGFGEAADDSSGELDSAGDVDIALADELTVETAETAEYSNEADLWLSEPVDDTENPASAGGVDASSAADADKDFKFSFGSDE